MPDQLAEPLRDAGGHDTRSTGSAGPAPCSHEPAENIPLTDLYVCGVMRPEDPAAPPPKLRWSLFPTQTQDAAVRMPGMAGAADYHTICGPVLARTTRDTLLAFAEGRRDARDDFGNIDIILRRSADWGATWSDIQVVHRNGDGQIGNTCPIVDHETGRIHLLTCTGVADEMDILTGSSYREVWLSWSDDDGVTWSRRRNISVMARRAGWYWYATGPAAGIQIRSGRYRGRLVAPANHSYLLPGGGHEYACHALYSDDGGATWQIGSASEPGGNENQIAEAGDDLLIQDIRLQTHRTGCRAYRYSRDGGATWDAMQSDRSRPCTRCQGSIISLDQRPDGTHNILVASNPAPIERRLDLGRREHLVARISTDGGRTWPRRLVVEPSYAGYSTLIEIDRDRVGIAYDRHPRLSFRTVYLEDCT